MSASTRAHSAGARVAGLIAIVSLAGVLCSACLGTAQAAQSAPITASGTVQADEVRIASETGGRVEEILALVGDRVQAGEAVVRLDTTTYKLQLGLARAAVEVAKADLAAVNAAPLAAEVEAARAQLLVAEAERDTALAAWQSAQRAVEQPQELDTQIVEAQSRVALAEQGAELARAQLAQQELLYGVATGKGKSAEEKEMAELQLLAAREGLAAAQADQNAAQTLLAQLWALRRSPLGLIAQANAGEGTYRIAERGVAVAQAHLDDVSAGATQEEIAMAEAAVAQVEAELRTLELQIERSTLVCPIDGVVTSRVVQAGELAAPAAAILTVADLASLTLDVYVPENRIGEVQLGQAVQVTVDSYPGASFAGAVTRISDQPEFTPRNVATAEERLNTFYAVTIRLDNSAGKLRPGMPADAAF